jgi:diguanylate cyclase (GGDEF)-like protein/PAS domain S-box-containing protein
MEGNAVLVSASVTLPVTVAAFAAAANMPAAMKQMRDLFTIGSVVPRLHEIGWDFRIPILFAINAKLKMFSRLPIRTKLALVTTVLLALISIAIYAYFPRKLEKQAREAVSEHARTIADMSAFSVAAPMAQGDDIAAVSALAGLRRNPDLVYFTLRDAGGRAITSFNDRVASSVKISAAEEARGRSVGNVGTPGETSGAFSADQRLYQTTTTVRFHGRAIGTLVAGFTLDRAMAAAARSRATVALIIVVAFGVGVAAIFALSGLITGRLKRMVTVTERIAAGALAVRADVDRDDEVGQLARSFNTMLDRLDTARAELQDLNHTLEMRVDERARELHESEKRYRRLFDRNLAGVYIAAVDGRVIECNEACARLFGYESASEFIAAGGKIHYANPRRRDEIMFRLEATEAITNEESQLQARDGKFVWVLENLRLTRGADGDTTIEGILLDVTDRKQVEAEISFKAYHDQLTGLPNRTLFVDRLQMAIAQAERTGKQLAVLFFDLDDLKSLNDTLGHAMGDTILKMVARRISLTVRHSDTVARSGGDEFLILLTEITDEKTAQIVAEKHLSLLRNPFIIDDDELHVSSSVGIAMYPHDGVDAEMLIRSADGAMYRAKAAGGNRVELCSGVAMAALGRSDLEQEIRSAIERDEFFLLFQPQVSIQDKRLVGVEALVRWQHPERGLVLPSGFISAAERSGLIATLGEVILHKACAQAAEWRKRGFIPPRLSVNVSPRQLYQRNFVGMVEGILAETGLDGAFLELELTESMTMQRSERSIHMLKRLRDRGISIAVDDFGTGQSSLSYLKEFPVDTVKIDKSFVVDLTRRASDQWIVRAVLLVANQLALRTVAEGVEDEEQCTFLRENGCAEIQGYLVSQPITAQELEKRFLEPTGQSAPRAASPRASRPVHLA